MTALGIITGAWVACTAPIPGKGFIMTAEGRIWTGVTIVIGAIIANYVPLIAFGGGRVSLHEANAVCGSGWGQFAQAVSGQAASSCGVVSAAHVVVIVLVVVFGSLAASGLIMARGK